MSFSIEVLSLSSRVRHVLLKNGIKTIFDIVEKWMEIPKYSNMGEKSIVEIIDKLNNWHEKKGELTSSETPNPSLDYKEYVGQSYEENVAGRGTRNHDKDLSKIPISNLKLPPRIYHMLRRKGVKHIGQIFIEWKNISSATQNEIQIAIASLQSATVDQAELVDTALPVPGHQGLEIIPSNNPQDVNASAEITIRQLEIMKEEKKNSLPKEFNFDDYFASLFGLIKPRHYSILEFRYGLRDGNKVTLEKAAGHFGVSRERIRQVESLALGELHNKINQVSQSFFLEKVKGIIEKRGGFISRSRLIYMLEKGFANKSYSMKGILEVVAKIFENEKNLRSGDSKLVSIAELSGWSTSNWNEKQIIIAAEKIINILSNSDSPMTWKEMLSLITSEDELITLNESFAYSIALCLSDNLKIQHQQDGNWSKNKRATQYSKIDSNIKQINTKPVSSTIHHTPEKEKLDHISTRSLKVSAQPIVSPPNPSSPLSDWENRFAPQLLKVELIGEIQVSKEELDTIALHIRQLYDTRTEQKVLSTIESYFPATFLVYMVGQGIHGYNGGDFWPAYETALHHSINRSDFGTLFENLVQHYGKPRFREMLERSLRYVSLILAHGGIPIFCLKDFFSNIVLSCAIRPQLLALEGDELIEETLKHASYTTNTDKPVLHFLEYGGSTASNLLDRSRKMLLSWQQNQTLLSADEAGLPAHLVQYFAGWTQENASLATARGPRNKLKRPQLSLDPWGLGIFLYLPSQPVSALGISDLNWKVRSGNYPEEIKAHTQRKGNQIETREITFRLKDVSEEVQVQFSQGENNYDWKINGSSPDNLILAFDPTTGQLQNHVMAKEVWLLYPNSHTLSMLAGEGSLLEVLPGLPGEWSRFKLEAWDLSRAIKLGLIQNDQVFREFSVRSQNELVQPSLEDGNVLSTDLEENPIPVYVGTPPLLHIPLTPSENLQIELSRWKINVECIGISDPEYIPQVTLGDLPMTVCSVMDNVASIRLDDARFLNSRPMGTFQIAIKGPLGRDATLPLEILPECEVTGLQELYIPESSRDPEYISFSVQTSLLDGVDVLNGADGIKIENEKPDLHHVMVSSTTSSVGLLVRRETVNHQFIGVPINLRINQLRWRFVRGNGIVENWLQNHFAISVQELLQEESPLLIVDLPGNDEANINLQIDLLDMQGNMIQQLKPTDRSSKRFSRFWRFDLSNIKHSMEMNDSAIFRVNLVGSQDSMGEREFNLPVLVLTREVQIMQPLTVVTSSIEQYHILMTWKERKQLRSRALILWSLFCPWQQPIIENIPDAVCGEYEFVVSKKEHAEGVYRMQMIVFNPWDTSPPPSLPPASNASGYFEVELSSPLDRLRELERGMIPDGTSQISGRIEISLIWQYLGEMDASLSDLELCCNNLSSATSREILSLRSILDQVDSKDLDQAFGNQIIFPEILNRLYENLKVGNITSSDFAAILKLAPHSENWSAQTCEILVQLEDPKIRVRALARLVVKDMAKAVVWVVRLMQEARLSFEDAVELLYEEKAEAIECLRQMDNGPFSEQLLDLLGRYNPYSGLPVAKVGSWVLTNAGWGRIDEILDPNTRISVDGFIEGDGKYTLSVSLHIYISYDLTGEKALIKMVSDEIIFPRANRIFICQHCSEFVTSKIEIFKNHMIASHGNALMYPGERINIVPLKSIQFNMNPQQNKRDQ